MQAHTLYFRLYTGANYVGHLGCV